MGRGLLLQFGPINFRCGLLIPPCLKLNPCFRHAHFVKHPVFARFRYLSNDMPIGYDQWDISEPDNHQWPDYHFSLEADCVVYKSVSNGRWMDAVCDQYTAGAVCQTEACYVNAI